MTTGEFLLKQADQLGIGDQIPEGMRESVRKVAVRERGTEDTLIGAAPRNSSPLAHASNAFLNIITGTRPAAAATLPPSYNPNLGAPAELTSFRPQVSSVTFDTGQPGIDVFFENKQFPAVLRGRVKEVGFQGSNDSGYGNFIVVESRDPQTGALVDVLYSHLAGKPKLKAGQPIDAGQIIGRQGGTGRVRSADGTIASIDFLAPAPAGSKSMTPYRFYDQLRRSIAQQLRN
jgi:murein DD-endopeptidase MepM/ murein hydrolase activator NlpD